VRSLQAHRWQIRAILSTSRILGCAGRRRDFLFVNRARSLFRAVWAAHFLMIICFDKSKYRGKV
jgi:hypothetical protein